VGLKGIHRQNFSLVHVDSRSEYAAVFGFVSLAFAAAVSRNVTGSRCSEVVGVVGDLDSGTAGIIHTLASRSNRSITLVSTGTSSNSLPVATLALPSVVDMRPLPHYGLVELLDILNWTCIGLVTDGAYYYQYAAELLHRKLSRDPQNTIIRQT
jgi:hypothetical protein